jgi:hypothetical protein
MDGVEKTGAAKASEKRPRRVPVAAWRISRGRTGGTTISDMLIQMGRAEGRKIIIVDGDLRNSTLSGLYPPGTEDGAMRPPSDDLVDMKELCTTALAKAVGTQSSMVVDLGGGDRLLQEYGREMALVELCEGMGMAPLALYASGPEMDDFEHILSIWRSEVFRPQRSILFLNEHLVPHGRSPAGAFTAIMERPELKEMIRDGLKVIVLPRLPSMVQVREAGLSLIDAMDGKPGKQALPLDPVRQFLVKQWLTKIREAFVAKDILEWLP